MALLSDPKCQALIRIRTQELFLADLEQARFQRVVHGSLQPESPARQGAVNQEDAYTPPQTSGTQLLGGETQKHCAKHTLEVISDNHGWSPITTDADPRRGLV